MRKFFTMLVLLMTAATNVSAQEAFVARSTSARAEESASQEQICQEFLKTTSEMWFLLSGICNKEDADRAAARFLQLVQRICALDDRLSHSSTASGLPLEVEEEVEGRDPSEGSELLESLQVRILESFEDINNEFLGICRQRCYGSEELRRAFIAAGESGMFAEEALAMLVPDAPPMTESESREELGRIRQLEEPDRALLETLRGVTDAASAGKAAKQLNVLTKRLQSLIPRSSLGQRKFDSKLREGARTATAPIEKILWDIRTELVRIAALPGYEAAAYDNFSDALNAVYESLGETHLRLFNDIFDASFRSDVDEALQEKENLRSAN